MTVEFNTSDLEDDCTLDDVKQFSCDLATELSDGFDGYAMPSVAIGCAHFLEAVVTGLEEEAANRIEDHVKGLPPDALVEAVGLLKSVVKDGKPVPTIDSVSSDTGQLMGILSMLRLLHSVRSKLHELKVVLATTVLPYSHRADSLGELTDLLDLEVSDAEKHAMRNRLKGGSNSPVDVKSGKELNDLCDDLFG